MVGLYRGDGAVAFVVGCISAMLLLAVRRVVVVVGRHGCGVEKEGSRRGSTMRSDAESDGEYVSACVYVG